MNNIPERRINLSLSNLLLIVATGLLLVLLWQLQGLLVILMIAIVLAATLAPTIDTAQQSGIPRWLAVILVYIGLLIAFDWSWFTDWSDGGGANSALVAETTRLFRCVGVPSARVSNALWLD